MPSMQVELQRALWDLLECFLTILSVVKTTVTSNPKVAGSTPATDVAASV
jgi:hypothetical protein